jgi:hypothetical protein
MSKVSETESTSRQFEKLLAGVEAAKRPNPLFGVDAKTAEQVVKGIVDPILCGAGLALVALNQYRWFARELSRLLREGHDRVLVLHLGALLDKWQRFGLNKSTLELLVCEVFEKLVRLQEPERERLVPRPEAEFTTKHAPSSVEGTQSHKDGGASGARDG